MTKKEKKLVGRLDEQASIGSLPVRVSRWIEIAFPLLLLVATLIPYLQTASFGFVNFDDPSYVYENPLLRNGLTLQGAREATFGFYEANWHPLVWLSYMAEIELFGLNPDVMHITNVVLHAINSLLVYVWLRRSTGDVIRSFLAGFFFALHPIHVESVAWITERKDVLSTLLMMATLIAYTEYVRRKSRQWFTAAIVFFGIGLSAKGMLVTVPVLLIFLDIWPLCRFRPFAQGRVDRATLRDVVVDKIPFLVLSITIAVVTILAQHSAGAVADIEALSMMERVQNSIVSYSRYILKSLWPIDLCVFYPMPMVAWPVETVVASVVIFAAITWIAWQTRITRTATLIGWCWYVFTLLPVIGIIQVGSQSIADRYMYVPMVGLTIIVLWAMPDRWLTLKVPAITVFGIASVFLMVLTSKQVAVWQDSITLFEHAVLVAPENNFTSRSNLGIAYTDAGRFSDAEQQLLLALKLHPTDADSSSNLARNLNKSGQFAKAEKILASAIERHPDKSGLWLHRGNAFRGLGNADSAVRSYKAAVDLDPVSSEALNNLGLMICRTNPGEGLQYIRRAIAANPKNAQAHNTLGNALVNIGDLEGAQKSYLEAIQLADLTEAKENLEYVRELLGQQVTPQ
jgi:Flp pilus assembly protein TadD